MRPTPSFLVPILAVALLSGCAEGTESVAFPEPSVSGDGITTPSASPSSSQNTQVLTACAGSPLPESLGGLVFDFTDDPTDGESILRMTNYGDDAIEFRLGEVGIAVMGAGPVGVASSVSLDPASTEVGPLIVLPPGPEATQSLEVSVRTDLVGCGDESIDGPAISPVLAVAIEGEALSATLLGVTSTW